MALQATFPGVSIQEFAPGAPIQGVGTSTAAFIGVAADGDLDTPTKVTSWDQFINTFGMQPVPGFFLWYAVRGFFDNGGQVCYCVRASNGRYAEGVLTDRTPAPDENDLIRVRARQPGNPTVAIQVEVADAHVVPDTTVVFRPTGNLSIAPIGRELTLGADEGRNFKSGDFITIAAEGERVQIVRISQDTIRIDQDLTETYIATDEVRLADLIVGMRTIRIHPVAPLLPGQLVPGTILTLTQGVGVTDSQIVASVKTEPLGGGDFSYRVTFREGLGSAFDLTQDINVQSEEFDLSVSQGGPATVYSNLSIESVHSRYFANIINSDNGLILAELIEPPAISSPPNNLPAEATLDLAGGNDETLLTIGAVDFERALNTLEEIDDVNLVSIPDGVVNETFREAVQLAILTHCQNLADRFGVLDALRPVPNQGLFGAGSVEEQRLGLDTERGYVALYYPWLRVPPATTGPLILVPPSGHICGIMARSDATRGVHKAPANELVNGALGVERTMSNIDQGQLNMQGINIIRVFQAGGRPIVWGARTTATDLNWQYVNIRRLFLFLEESIQEGIEWAVFEPNNLQLWQKLKRTITEFLKRAWRDGALFGAKPEEAFYVRIDEILNPFSEQALGRLHIEVGVRLSYPAEFICVRIGIWDGGSQVTEV